jgi:TRAF3-interacting protein 1
MQEKLLKRPPPRYVYDIVMATMNLTGFPKGLFTDDEIDPKFFDKSPKHKLLIFSHLIKITQIVLNKEIDIKPINIRNN